MLDRRKYDLSLRNVAERHPNDIIANAASALAVKMESLGTAYLGPRANATPPPAPEHT